MNRKKELAIGLSKWLKEMYTLSLEIHSSDARKKLQALGKVRALHKKVEVLKVFIEDLEKEISKEDVDKLVVEVYNDSGIIKAVKAYRESCPGLDFKTSYETVKELTGHC